MDGVKGIFASRTVISALVSIVALLAGKAGYTVIEADQAVLVDAVMTIVAALGGAGAIYFRAKATKTIKAK